MYYNLIKVKSVELSKLYLEDNLVVNIRNVSRLGEGWSQLSQIRSH